MTRGTIILNPFPFTDLQGNTVRPAIIISSDKRKGDDVIVAFISSVFDPGRLQETDFVLRKGEEGFTKAGLKVTSIFKMDKLATIDKAIILGELGVVSKEIFQNLDEKLKIALDLC